MFLWHFVCQDVAIQQFALFPHYCTVLAFCTKRNQKRTRDCVFVFLEGNATLHDRLLHDVDKFRCITMSRLCRCQIEVFETDTKLKCVIVFFLTFVLCKYNLYVCNRHSVQLLPLQRLLDLFQGIRTPWNFTALRFFPVSSCTILYVHK